ncbi:MAG: hypothetical protein JW818_16045 [Pirellulales bacterium]|nr:hypothetical protein [Pirellulales bacterium]
MASPSPSSPDRSFWGSFVRPLKVVGSAAVATGLLVVVALVLIMAVAIDHLYNLEVAQFAVYHTWWFAVLLCLVGVNVIAAALTRLPWRRRHVGFLLVHLGVVFILIGAWATFRQGIDGRMVLFEGETGGTALENRPRLLLRVEEPIEQGGGMDVKHEGNPPSPPAPLPKGEGRWRAKTVEIPFDPGPFNWCDYGWGKLPIGPWHVAHRDKGVLHDKDGVTLELVDYLADSRPSPVPRLALGVSSTGADKAAAHGAVKTLEFLVSMVRTPHEGHQRVLFGTQRQADPNTGISFRTALNSEETEAFSLARPEGSLGKLGQLVLCVEGKPYRLLVDDLLGKPPVPLGKTGLRVELDDFKPSSLTARLKITRQDAPAEAPSGMMLLSAIRPNVNQPDRRHGVYGDYWFEGKRKPDDKAAEDVPEVTRKAAAQRRIDILQTPEEKLIYRQWNGSTLLSDKPSSLPTDGSEVTTFSDTDKPVRMFVKQYVAAVEPTIEMEPEPFRPGEEVATFPAARVRLTVDRHAEEFWLTHRGRGTMRETMSRTVDGDGRRVTVEMDDRPFDLGFQIALHKSTRRLDPGTSQPAHYFSRVDILGQPTQGDNADETPILMKDATIEINRPLAVVAPTSGRTFRIFQSSFEGPFLAGSETFDRHVDGRRPCDELSGSVFSIHYNPGRHWFYAGCLMLIVGIVVMYYLKT